MKTLRLSATLAALILAASTASAAVMDLGNALGPSGQYTSQAYYQAMLGGQPMTAAQQTYADQEDQLRQLGFREAQVRAALEQLPDEPAVAQASFDGLLRAALARLRRPGGHR